MNSREKRGQQLQDALAKYPAVKDSLDRIKAEFGGCKLLGIRFEDGTAIGNLGSWPSTVDKDSV